MRQAERYAVKILVVSGFLGAGKTTFIKTLTQTVRRSFVVYENEYAGAGIDSKRLEDNKELSVWESLDNCICCSGKADFTASILTISNSLDPEYLIVEPTGLANLSNIVDNIRNIEYDRIMLLDPVAVVDAANFQQQRLLSPEIALDQVQTASTIVLSKMDTALPEEVEVLTQTIRQLNPTAEIEMDAYSNLDRSWFLDLLEERTTTQVGDRLPARPSSSDAISAENLTLTNVALPSPVELIALLNALSFGTLGDVLRAKGSLPCNEQWLRFDLVGQSWQITGEEEPDPVASCAIIGTHLNQERIRGKFQFMQ